MTRPEDVRNAATCATVESAKSAPEPGPARPTSLASAPRARTRSAPTRPRSRPEVDHRRSGGTSGSGSSGPSSSGSSVRICARGSRHYACVHLVKCRAVSVPVAGSKWTRQPDHEWATTVLPPSRETATHASRSPSGGSACHPTEPSGWRQMRAETYPSPVSGNSRYPLSPGKAILCGTPSMMPQNLPSGARHIADD